MDIAEFKEWVYEFIERGGSPEEIKKIVDGRHRSILRRYNIGDGKKFGPGRLCITCSGGRCMRGEIRCLVHGISIGQNQELGCAEWGSDKRAGDKGRVHGGGRGPGASSVRGR